MNRKTKDGFICDAKNLHGGKYSYSRVDYINNHTKVCITCKKHGDFWQTPNSHLSGKGCPICAKYDNLTKRFVSRAKKKHCELIDYSNVEYVNSRTKVKLICHKKDLDGKEHGVFLQLPYQHLLGYSCPKCALEVNREKHKSTSVGTFKENGMRIHGGKYSYDLVDNGNYNGIKKKVPIICPKHGVFWQTPDKHINSRHGCPMCKSSHLERDVRNMLKSMDLIFIEQKRFDWLGKLSLDFYIPSFKIAIECQGIQHFVPRDFAYKGNEWATELYNQILERDVRKNRLCSDNGVKITYVTDCDDNIIENSKNKSLYCNIIKEINLLRNVLQFIPS